MKIGLFVKGAAMGIAEAIPGVSGGTIAFITGIYLELIETIKGINWHNLRLVFKDRKAFWIAVNGNFIIRLLLGMLTGLVIGILLISYLLENHQILLWSFFFGLVLASAVYLSRDIQWNIALIFLFLVGAVLAFSVTQLAPAAGSHHPAYLFMSGCLAVSALMLPGVSGSFLILLLGLYDDIITGLKDMISNQNFEMAQSIAIFGLGIIVGLFSFARVLSFMFKKFPHATMATMIGILIGSLGKLWPWKIIEKAFDKLNGQEVLINDILLPDPERFKVLSETMIGPSGYRQFADPQLIAVLVCFIAGLILVVFLSRAGNQKEQY